MPTSNLSRSVLVGALSSLALLAACGPSPTDAPRTGDEVQERAADGIWYRASNVELRGKGVLATWSVEGRQPTQCRAVD